MPQPQSGICELNACDIGDVPRVSAEEEVDVVAGGLRDCLERADARNREIPEDFVLYDLGVRLETCLGFLWAVGDT